MSAAIPPPRPRRPRKLWFERVMAIVVLLNLGLVLFDLTFVPLRNFWLLGNLKVLSLKVPVPLPPPLAQPLPAPFAGLCQPLGQSPTKASLITQCYDPIKGIAANRDTEAYLLWVDRLSQQVATQGLPALDAPVNAEIATTLQALRQASAEMISSNPFAAADKSGTLERIKNRMRDHMQAELGSDSASATDAFNRFWSSAHLRSTNWQAEIGWFDRTLRPLMQTNYDRAISETGAPTNDFWQLDTPFVLLFLTEFLARTFYLSRRSGTSWWGAMVWRWYDLPLIFPFGLLFAGWAWLRVIPATVRLHQAQFVDLHQIRDQAITGFVGAIAPEVTRVVVVQVIDQLQSAIRRGEVLPLLLQTTKARIDLNNVDEVAEISNLLVQLSVYQVFPKIQPEVEALVSHGVTQTLNQSPAYQALKHLPGMTQLTTELTDRLAKDAIQASYGAVTGALEDPIGAKLTQQLVQRLSETLRSEVQRQKLLPELQALVDDLLEEIKISYMHRSTEISAERLMSETRFLKQSRRDRSP